MADEKKEIERLRHLPSHKDYDLVGLLGQGAFAKVWYAIEQVTKQRRAIKIIELESSSESTPIPFWDEIRKETSIMHSLKHKNVVSCLSSFVVEEELWLVMPLLSGGSCSAVLRQHPEFKLGIKDEALLATILRDVLQGLMYFHKSGRIHRDIKSGNVLLSQDGVAKISDFGVSGSLIENGYKKNNRLTFTGTPCWMAPEVMESKPHNTKADIWSFGITALELAFGKPPYASERPMKVMLLIMQQDPPSARVYKDTDSKDVFSKEFHDMVKKCLMKKPEKRPSAEKLMNEKWFKRAKGADYVRNRILFMLPDRKIKPVKKSELPKSQKHSLGSSDNVRTTQSTTSFDFSDRVKHSKQKADLMKLMKRTIAEGNEMKAGKPYIENKRADREELSIDASSSPPGSRKPLPVIPGSPREFDVSPAMAGT